MNILIISYDFCLEAGGIQNTSYLLAEEFMKYMNVFTFCSSDGNSPNVPGIRSFKSKYSNKRNEEKLYNQDATNAIEKIHLQNHLDYVLVLHYSYSIAAYCLKKKYGVPYGIMAHGNEVLRYPFLYLVRHPRSRLNALFKRKKLLNYATHVFANTCFTKELVQKITSRGKINVINPPISMMPLNDNPISSKDGFLLSVGRIVERKGYQNLIKALPQLIETFPKIKYIIAGNGEYETQLRKLVRELNIEGTVCFKGRITEEEKSKLLSECSLFIMPSLKIENEFQVEGFGISLIEANAYGKFIISTKSGGIPEAVLENVTGFLVEENDVGGLVDAIKRFYTDDFCFDPKECINWAMQRHISFIAKQYYDIIIQSIPS